MRLAISAILIGSIHAQNENEYDDSEYGEALFDFGDFYESDDADFYNNCAMKCNNGDCVLKEEVCNAKVFCPEAEDEQNCESDESGSSGKNTKSNRQGDRDRTTTTEAPGVNLATKGFGGFRGRFPGMPGMYAPQESSFRGFDDNQYAVFQRKNRKLIQHVMAESELDNERLQQMMKMMFYMTDGKISMANFMGYGCHCNADGSGHGGSLDDIDAACARNAGCRKCAQTDFSCDPSTKYIVNGAIGGRADGTACANRPDTCARSLCECDLQLIRDIIEDDLKSFDADFQSYNGFDQSTCSSFGNMDLGRSLQQNNGGSKSGDDGQCCGKYPHRQPINGENRSCCRDKTYNNAHFECCAGSDIVPIGSC